MQAEILPPKAEAAPAPASRPWITAASAALLLLLMAAFWWMVGMETQRDWRATQTVHVTAGEQHYRIPLGEVPSLQQYSTVYFERSARQGRAALHENVETHLDAVFERVESRLPAFLDWYYSLGGEYSRIGMTLASMMGMTDGEFVASRASAMLFDDAGWDAALMQMEQQTRLRLVRHDAATRNGWVEGLMERLAPHQVPAPLAASDERPASVAAEVSLASVQKQMEADSLLSLSERVTLSTGGALAGVTLWRGAARGSAAVASRRAAARGATRGAARVGTAAAGGGVVCAPGGPLAVACALTAGTVAWVGFDWALLRLEETMKREEMEASLKASLEEFRGELESQIKSALDEDIGRHQERLQATIHREFVPLKGTRARQDDSA